MNSKRIIAQKIEKALASPAHSQQAIEALIAIPPDEKLGDFAFPCFSFAKEMRKAPAAIANDLREAILSSGDDLSLFSRIEVVGGYLNFFLNRQAVIRDVVGEVLRDREEYGKSEEGQGKRVVVEFSSPNIAKPFHIGHLCSTAIGNSIERLYRFLGYDTVKVNHIGDWGTQFGKLISAYKRWGEPEKIEADPINELLKIYVKFHAEAKEHPELEDEARHYFLLLEQGEEEVTRLWKFFVDVSLKEFNRMYELLGISFDSYAGESFYSDKMPEIVDMLKEKRLLEESEGAMVVRFDEDSNLPPCIILKSDGSTIYATRDIAAAVYRKRHYDFYKNIYVVGTPQALHFRQVFSVIRKLGFSWADDCLHVGFGHVRFPDRALSTRNGDVILLEDVLRDAIGRTREIIETSTTTKDIENIDSAAEKIGVGAVLFAFLKNGRERDIVFKLDEILDFEGESGPYVQYSYARARSVLRKAESLGIDYKHADPGLLGSDEEYTLVKHINRYQETVREAAAKYEPSIVTRYVADLAQYYNKFYNTCNVMRSEEALRAARLALTEAAAICIRSALNLIGVDVVEKM